MLCVTTMLLTNKRKRSNLRKVSNKTKTYKQKPKKYYYLLTNSLTNISLIALGHPVNYQDSRKQKQLSLKLP